MDELPDIEHLHLLAENFEHSYPHEIIAWASHTYGEGLVMATGFGPEGVVIMHVVSQVAPNTKIFYLDTDLFFPETYALRDELQQRFNLSFERVAPTLSLDQQTEQYGPELWARNPNQCCGLRKVEPLRAYLRQKKAWITGIRRDQTRTRQTSKPIEWDHTNGLVKLNPLLNWSSDQVWTYIYLFDLPTNALHKSGYPSIGCWPCTRPATEGADPRSGRWVGFQKVECGIHMEAADQQTIRRPNMTTPPVCNYEGSDYQTSFWDQGGREYEDRAEAIALKRLLPARGKLLLELGAGAGRNTPRYTGYERIVLLDYSRTQLEQARARLGNSPRYIYVAADIYKLPFVDGLFDGATMIRALHHMADAPKALRQVRNVLQPGASFILEYANKLNLKAILRYALGKQTWSPFTLEPVEFAALNFDFHPKAIRRWLTEVGFQPGKTLTVSHFRLGFLKRSLPAAWLAALDGLFQPTGALFQLTPSVFVAATAHGQSPLAPAGSFFKCPECAHSPLEEHPDALRCPACGRSYAFRDGIYDFRGTLE